MAEAEAAGPADFAERMMHMLDEAALATGKCALYARHVRMVAARVAETLQMLRAAADADSDARAIYNQGEAQRRTGTGLFVTNLRRAGDLRARLSDDQATDAIWALSPDILWTLLVVQRGWTGATRITRVLSVRGDLARRGARRVLTHPL
jgi:hypothetical protein